MTQLHTNSDDRIARLKAGLSDDPKVSRSVDRLRLRRPANVLAGATLHAAARQEQGLELSELEDSLLEVLRGFIPEEEIAAAGKAYREASPAAVDRVFPAEVGHLEVGEPYTFADLGRDLSALAPGILAQPNVSIVDVTTLAEGQPVDDAAFLEAMAATGSGATVLTAPRQEVPDALVLPTELPLKRFTCVRDTADQWGGSDEIHWAFAAGADCAARSTYASPQFGDVDTGESRDFAADAYVFAGEVAQHLITNIQCWEKDQGDLFGELRARLRDVADTCSRAAVGIMQDGEKQEAALAAVIAVVAALIDWLLGWLVNDDDLVGDRSVAFTRAGLQALNGRDTVLDFTSSGHYRLTFGCRTQALRQPTASTQISYRILGSNEAYAVIGSSPFGPAVAQRNDLNVLYVTDSSGQSLGGRRGTGLGWEGWWNLRHVSSGARPALAQHGTKTIFAVRGAGTDRSVYSGIVSTAAPYKFPDVTSSHGPALAVFNNAVHCVVADGADGRLMHATAPDGTTWSPFTPVAGDIGGLRSTGSPALAVFNNKLYCVYAMQYPDSSAQHDGTLWSVVFDGTRWSALPLPGDRKVPPGIGVGLAAFGTTKLYIATRGPKGDQSLYWAVSFDGSTWSAFTQIPGAWTADTPSLAFWDATPVMQARGLYLTYRGPGTE
ncbi:hypothetical protein [Streptomyces huiliensis]|uniref:hypothetical protein n=1 Tax=Streptomyces huiliensis TaxID=2876027 RepID=UPI001CBB2CA1|nr:hypothetical protein [Streptomyces huiliensis]MBZ4318566.1 hypothetical protein [Streptomyces huiliensis]